LSIRKISPAARNKIVSSSKIRPEPEISEGKQRGKRGNIANYVRKAGNLAWATERIIPSEYQKPLYSDNHGLF